MPSCHAVPTISTTPLRSDRRLPPMRDLIIDVALFALCVTVSTALMAWGTT